MTVPDPFAYPTAPVSRRHGPSGYKDYTTYKPFLRDEFVFRCVYCLERETWYPSRHAAFAVEHFEPKSVRPDLVLNYENLYYACSRCNSVKWTRRAPLDPCCVALDDHLRVRDDGEIEGLTLQGQEMIALFDLADAPAVEFRRHVLRVLQAKREAPNSPAVQELFKRWFGYPDDLPDLEGMRPDGGNSRPEGVKTSHHARRLRNELPEVY